jgi:hypothetical protein
MLKFNHFPHSTTAIGHCRLRIANDILPVSVYSIHGMSVFKPVKIKYYFHIALTNACPEFSISGAAIGIDCDSSGGINTTEVLNNFHSVWCHYEIAKVAAKINKP